MDWSNHMCQKIAKRMPTSTRRKLRLLLVAESLVWTHYKRQFRNMHQWLDDNIPKEVSNGCLEETARISIGLRWIGTASSAIWTATCWSWSSDGCVAVPTFQKLDWIAVELELDSTVWTWLVLVNELELLCWIEFVLVRSGSTAVCLFYEYLGCSLLGILETSNTKYCVSLGCSRLS